MLMNPRLDTATSLISPSFWVDRFRKNGRDWLAFLGIYAVSLVLLSMLLPGVLLNLPEPTQLTVGSTWDRRIVADRDYTFIDLENTQKRQEARLKLVRPVYRIQEDLTFSVVAQFDEAAAVLNKFFSDRTKKELVQIELEALLPQLNTGLILEEAERQFRTAEAWLRRQRESLLVSLEKGIVDDLTREIPPQGIEVRLRRGSGDIRQFYPRDQVLTLRTLRSDLGALAGQLAVANAHHDRQASEEAERQALSATPPVLLSFRKGEAILEKDELLTEDKLLRLAAFRTSLAREFWSKFLVLMITLFVLLVLGYKTLRLGMSSLSDRSSTIRFVTVVWLLNLGFQVAMMFLGDPSLRVLLSPLGLSVLLTVLLSNQLTGVLLSLFLTLPLVFFLPGGSWGELGLPAALSTFVFNRVEKRFSVILSGLFYGLTLGMYLVLSRIWEEGFSTAVLALGGTGSLNGLISAVAALGLLPVLEYVFNFTTRFRLQELSDLNSPILKKMLSLAPGTYAHSINVSHLAENAARAIGADPLLARVGAIYHDIGKIEQAEFFVENQRGQNPHDSLAPSMSAAILKNHVSQGVELARELRLPAPIIDIIRQHHGCGLIEFFYNKALKQGKGRVDIEEFRYPGPNPRFRESGIVMVADTIEAASRTLQNPEYSFLEEFVENLVNKKIAEGLLIDSGLTLHDIMVIKEEILHTLAGQFHSRIEYPGLVYAP